MHRKRFLIVVLGLAAVLVLVRSRFESASRSVPAQDQATLAERDAPSEGQGSTESPPAPLPDLSPTPVLPTAATPPARSVLQRIAQNDSSVFKLTPDQVQAHLARNQTNAESLLAAFNVTNDKEFLRGALRRYPGNPFVLASVLANDVAPELRQELLDQFKQASSNNPLANYWLAREHMKNKQPDLALNEFADAWVKTGFHDFNVERIQGLEEMYLATGYSAAEAKALAMASVQIPAMAQMRQLGRDMASLGRQYVDAGDTASAQTLAEMGVGMAANLRTAGANSLLGQIIGTTVEREFLAGLDPNATYDFIGQPVTARLAELQAQDRSIRDSAKFYEGWIQHATDAQLVIYYDRLKLYGESAALDWARAQSAVKPEL